MKLLKALCGCIESPLLFYKKLKKDLEEKGFVVNPHDPCVANKMIHGKQMTVTWHVDDLKVSHADPKQVDGFIEWIKSEHGKVTAVKPSRGKVHDCLAMTLDCETPGEVKIKMKDHVEKMLKEFPGSPGKTSRLQLLITCFKSTPRLTSWNLRRKTCSTLLWQRVCFCARGQGQTFNQSLLFHAPGSRSQMWMTGRSSSG